MKKLFIDTETTGTNYLIHGIHQLSGYVEIDGKVVEEFNFKIRPFEGAIIEEQALIVAGVTLEQIMQYPPEMESYFEFKNMLTRYVESFNKEDKFIFIAYNAKFDVEFVNSMFLRNGNKYFFSLIYGGIVDVIAIFIDKFESALYLLENFKLLTVAKFLSIELDESKLHDSLYDIFVTREVYYKIKNTDYSYNHIRIDELKRMWDSVWPKIHGGNFGKCIITFALSEAEPEFLIPWATKGMNEFYTLKVEWENPENFEEDGKD